MNKTMDTFGFRGLALRGIVVSAMAVLSAGAAFAEDDVVLDGFSVGPVKLMARERGAWKVDFRREAEGGVEYAVVEMTSDREDFPAAFNLSFNFPKRDTVGRWKPSSNCDGFGMYWNLRAPVGKIAETDFRSGLPICACYSAGNRNRFTFAASESSEPLVMRGEVREEDNRLYYAFNFYDQKISRRRHVVAKLRIDARDVFWSDAVREGADWMTAVSGRTPASVPDAAFAPLYSTWYNFHQNVFAEEIERECAIASGMGMKTLIVDDGWQTDDTNRGYAYCGDWKVSKRRFPDMKAHVAKVHSYGMKYMLWYSVPFVGDRSENLARFKGKFLYHNGGISTNCLDPRFPEVREFLIGTYEKAVREWDIDGLKLDFIDSIHTSGKDPATKDNFKGRDFKSVTAATEQLLADVYARLKAIKPDILVEFRQPYVGPSIRAGANMLRVSDCPANPQHNRTGIVNLRLTSGATAVHADMLEWHPTDTPEAAALNVLSCMFGTVQYSMKLAGLDAKHVAMIGHWSRFGGAHVGALQRGKFRAYHPELNYPLLEGEDAKERIFGVYAADIAVKTGPLDRTVYVLNATEADSLVVDLGGAATVAAYDTWGKEVSRRSFAAGPARLAVPPAGYLEITR